MLEWLYQETNGDLRCLEKPAEYLGPDVVVWLYEHGRRHLNAQLDFRYANLQDFQDESIKQCLMYEEDDISFTTVNVERVVDQAIKNGHLELLQWLYQHRPELFDRACLGEGVSFGCFEVVKWLYEKFPKSYFDDPRPRSRFILSPLFDFEIIPWILCEFEWKNQVDRIVWMGNAIKFCAGAGSLEMMQLLNHIRIINR